MIKKQQNYQALKGQFTFFFVLGRAGFLFTWDGNFFAHKACENYFPPHIFLHFTWGIKEIMIVKVNREEDN